MSVVLSGCATTIGGVPRLEPADPAAGVKMLRPAAIATVCRSEGVLSPAEPRDLLGTAFRELLSRDEEATAVVDAQIESTSWTIGVYGRRCVTLTGDVVRFTTTVLLPMGKGHHVHEAP